MSVEDTVVAGTLSSNGYGLALYADIGAMMTATDVVLHGNFQQILVAGGATAEAARLVIVDASDNESGVGLVSQDGATISLSSSVVRGNVTGGVALFTGSMTSIGNLYQANSGSTWDTDGFYILDGSTLESFGDVVLDHVGLGYQTSETDPSSEPNVVTVRRGLVEGQYGTGELYHGMGFLLTGGTDAEITDTVVRGNNGVGIHVTDLTGYILGDEEPRASSLVLTTSRIEGTLPSEADGSNGVALQALGEVEVFASQSAFLDSRGAGVHVAGGMVDLSACVIEGVASNVVALFGLGLASTEGGDGVLVQGTSAEGDAFAPEDFDGGFFATDSWIDDAARAAALVHAASATFTASRLGNATYGVVEQAGGEAVLESSLVEAIDEEAPSSELAVP